MLSVGIDFGTINLRSSTCRNLTFSDPIRLRACVAITPEGTLHTGEQARESCETESRRGITHLKQFVRDKPDTWQSSAKRDRRQFWQQNNQKVPPELLFQYPHTDRMPSRTMVSIEKLTAKCFRDVVNDGNPDRNFDSVVIAVPNSFNKTQLTSIEEAGKMAGFTNVKCLDEQMAAMIGCVTRSLMEGNGLQDVDLVFICNGGFHELEVTAFWVENGSKITRDRTFHHTALGGSEFVEKLISYCERKIFNSDDFGPEVIVDEEAFQQLRFACEKAQETLSNSTWAKIEVRCLTNNKDFVCQITREVFEDLCGRMMGDMSWKLRNHMKKFKVDLERCEIIAAGELFRMPLLRRIIGWFSDKKVNSSVIGYGQDAVAFGAAAAAELQVLDPEMYQAMVDTAIFDARDLLRILKNGQQASIVEILADPDQLPDYVCDGNIMFYESYYQYLLVLLGPVQIAFKSRAATGSTVEYFVHITQRDTTGKIVLLYRAVIDKGVRLETITGKSAVGKQWTALSFVDSDSFPPPNTKLGFKYGGLIINCRKPTSFVDVLNEFEMRQQLSTGAGKTDRLKGSTPEADKSSSFLICPVFLADIRIEFHRQDASPSGTPVVDHEGWAVVEIRCLNDRNQNHKILCYRFPHEVQHKVLLDLEVAQNLEVQHSHRDACRVVVSAVIRKIKTKITLTLSFTIADVAKAFEFQFREVADNLRRKVAQPHSPEILVRSVRAKRS